MYEIMYYAGMVLAVAFLIATIILFIRNKVWKLIGDVTGWNAKRAIRHLQRKGAEDTSKTEAIRPETSKVLVHKTITTGTLQAVPESEESEHLQQVGKTRKKKQRQKENAVSMWIRILSAVAILLVVVCSVLAVRFFWSKRDENLIVQLSDLDYVETEEAGSSKASKTYILDGQFERMSVKATMKQLSAASSSEDKLLQIWIDDSLVYEIEAGQSEKEDWTFAIDLRGVDRMTIFTAKETTLDDVQVIRQSAEKENESTNAKNGSSKK